MADFGFAQGTASIFGHDFSLVFDILMLDALIPVDGRRELRHDLKVETRDGGLHLKGPIMEQEFAEGFAIYVNGPGMHICGLVQLDIPEVSSVVNKEIF